MEAINLLAVLAAVVANMVLGSLWYGPLFGSRWVRATGRNPDDAQVQAVMKQSMPKAMSLMLVFSIITAVVLSVLLFRYAGDVVNALTLALMLWLGFALPVKINDVFFGGNNRQLLWIDGLWLLLSLLVSSFILALWK